MKKWKNLFGFYLGRSPAAAVRDLLVVAFTFLYYLQVW
jgi:hypothetical protein